MKKKIAVILTVFLLVAVFSFASFKIVKTLTDYREAKEIYGGLQQQFVETKSKTDEATPVKTPTETQSEDIPQETYVNETTNEPPFEEPLTEDPVEQAPISVDFSSLLEINTDIVGWIYCPDSPINYPVAQGADNNEYLRRDLNGKYLISGTVFTDYRNGSIGEDRNYIVYGHNMKDGSMFGSLVKYKQPEYYDKHPVLYYLTPDGDYRIELYAGIVIPRDAVIYQPNPDKAEFTEFLQNAKANSTFISDTVLEEGDVLITLSTCSYEYDNARYVVIGKMIRL